MERRKRDKGSNPTGEGVRTDSFKMGIKLRIEFQRKRYFGRVSETRSSLIRGET